MSSPIDRKEKLQPDILLVDLKKKLSPTEGAAHCFRVYHQFQTWLGNRLLATNWGWKQGSKGLMPKLIRDREQLIPNELLQKICCSCTTGCEGKRCGCRKLGLRCTNLCTNCDTENCSNMEYELFEDIDDSDPIDEISAFDRRQSYLEDVSECEDDRNSKSDESEEDVHFSECEQSHCKENLDLNYTDNYESSESEEEENPPKKLRKK